jgi:hypothetical protein
MTVMVMIMVMLYVKDYCYLHPFRPTDPMITVL